MAVRHTKNTAMWILTHVEPHINEFVLQPNGPQLPMGGFVMETSTALSECRAAIDE